MQVDKLYDLYLFFWAIFHSTKMNNWTTKSKITSLLMKKHQAFVEFFALVEGTSGSSRNDDSRT